jgi:hypothetical protein
MGAGASAVANGGFVLNYGEQELPQGPLRPPWRWDSEQPHSPLPYDAKRHKETRRGKPEKYKGK